jgi:5-enolpyruvylshikimate-3-phosphate synthase
MRADERDFEQRQRELNPHRREEQHHARDHAVETLHQRGVVVHEHDASDELADLLDAVDAFIAEVEARGGDTFVNTPQSSEPATPEDVLPTRGAGESVRAYRARVAQATERLRRLPR